MRIAKPIAELILIALVVFAVVMHATGAEPTKPSGQPRMYRNELRVIENPRPLLADHPEFVEPVIEERHYEAPPLIDEPAADLDVRAWRFSYNARGIIEIPNRLRADRTAVIVVHPWGIDDGQGWRTPEPAGVADFCTPQKNHLAGRHTREVIDPFLQRLRGKVALVMYSMRSEEKPVHRKLYRSIRHTPTAAEREEGKRELAQILNSFDYRGQPLPAEFKLSDEQPVKDYFQQFPGLAFGADYNNVGFWDLPVPVTDDITVFPNDVVIYDDDGYPALRDFLKGQGVRHVLMAGYATDMCYCSTTAGYQNLSQDFNVFLVGDATLATFPGNTTPRFATNAHISFAALNQLVTQVSWVKLADNSHTVSQTDR
jgi:nicotinamidase-related amidase